MPFSNMLKKGRGFGLAFFFIYLFMWATPASAVDAYFRLENQWVSEPEPLSATIDDWGSEFGKGERQWAISEFALGVRYKFLDVSVQQRALADARINSKAAEFYGRIAREENLQPGTKVPVHIQVNGFSAQGLRLGYWHDASNWTLAAGVTLLQAKHLMHGTLNGEFEATAVDEFSANATVDYMYFRDALFKRPDIDTAEGQGRAFDVSATWSPTASWDLSVEAMDLFAEIKWKDAPFTVAEAETDQKNYDEDGYAVFSPLYSGRQGYRDVFHQKLDPRYKIATAYSRGAWSAHLEGQYQFGYGFAGIGAGYVLQNDASIKALYWLELQSIELQLNKAKWHLSLAADQVSWSNMKALQLNIAYGI